MSTLTSYKDGSLGSGPNMSAIRDGSLGQLNDSAYMNGSLGALNMSAFQDGSLGSHNMSAFQDGSLGECNCTMNVHRSKKYGEPVSGLGLLEETDGRSLAIGGAVALVGAYLLWGRKRRK